MSVVQILVISINLFLLYRFLLKSIGVRSLGIWSVVLAVTSVSQIANFGLSGSVVKFVSKYQAHGQKDKTSSVIQTAILTIAVSVGALLILGYPVARFALKFIIENKSLSSALSILPLAFIAFWLLLITSVAQSGLDGIHRIDIRSWILIADSFSYLVISIFMAKRFGLLGLAYARVLENVLVFIASWIFLRNQLPFLPWLPRRWNKATLKEIFGYGANLQIISIASLLHHTVTMSFLSRFGGLSMAGYYEMAAKMLWQVRSLIASATFVIAPTIAHLKETGPEKIKAVYATSYELLLYLAIPLFSMLIVAIPFISLVWIEFYEKNFIFSASILALGWFFNLISVPAYYVNMGIGELRWNVRSVLGAGLLNVVLGVAGGFLAGGRGVIVGWILALIGGSLIVLIPFYKKEAISARKVLPRTYWAEALVCLVGIGVSFILRKAKWIALPPLFLAGGLAVSIGMMIIIPMWMHPMRKRLIGWVGNDLLKRTPEISV